MKNILLVLLLFASSYATAQTLTVSNTTYNIVSGELLTTANSYTRGFIVGRASALNVSCNPTSVMLDIREDASGSGIQLGTYIDQRTPGATTFQITWRHIRINGSTVEVRDISNLASNNGDLDLGFRAANHPLGGRLEPLDGFVQPGDIIEVVYVDTCGIYIDEYVVPSNEGAIRVPPRNPNRPPKIQRPVI